MESAAAAISGLGILEEAPDTAFRNGFLLGILVGAGHFGGDGRQPQITLRMHTRHESLFRWLESNFPGGRLYGPYVHGGRSYYQWMARGRFLAETVLPILERRLTPQLDEKAYVAYQAMRASYARRLGLEPATARLATPEELAADAEPAAPAERGSFR